ncbi:MAG: peptidylprolyl isomerase [Bacteroidales bacterium]|nr:peptidylprolyl isomerase [Bacteroidales bacterium]
MKTEKNKVVAVSYELRIEEKSEEIIDLAYEEKPLEFLFGNGMMLQKFEDNLAGLSIGDTFNFKLTSEEGYGVRNEENISEIPKNVFEQNGKIEAGLLDIGNVIPLQDDKGNRFNGQVISVTGELVKLDFNHPLAGEDLFFTGKIVNIREATEQELEHKHVHSHGHDH